MGLPRAHRLRQARAFRAVYRQGQSYKGPHLTLRTLRSDPAGNPGLDSLRTTRIGISVSQKVSKRAVVRNRIKRQIRAIFRHLLPQLASGWWLVVVVRPQAVECGYDDFLRELEQLLVDAEVLNGNS